ncbi:patatin-like phospholipase family protein [candidate division KSB1 bacterium]|nr:patatin-like phospholipase family protein [candidate division KSB1 bacterium]
MRSGSVTAFVFAGGGSLGAVEVGMLEALVEEGIFPDLIVGASVGAINGAYFAAYPDRDGVRALARIWRGEFADGSVICHFLGSGTERRAGLTRNRFS